MVMKMATVMVDQTLEAIMGVQMEMEIMAAIMVSTHWTITFFPLRFVRNLSLFK